VARRSTLPKSRPGGRSHRVKGTVFEAVEALLLENPGDLPSMTAIAERAQVNPTSLYRRWGDVRRLAGEVAVERLMREHPIPDTGSLRGDLIAWATAVARSLGSPRNVLLLRILTSVPQQGVSLQNLKKRPIGRRIAELEAMLGRAAARSEVPLSLGDTLELVLAPLYLHALFLGPITDPGGVSRLVDRALLLSPGGDLSVLPRT
jgi:AcrR family transcriptional regulator